MMHQICKETCKPIFNDLIGIKKLTIEYHKLENLRDLLVPSKLRKCKKKMMQRRLPHVRHKLINNNRKHQLRRRKETTNKPKG